MIDKKQLLATVSAVCILLLLALARPAAACDGNACGDIQTTWENNCHVVKNRGTHKVNVQWGPFGCVLWAGDSCQIKNLDGSCIGTIVGDLKATYAN